MRVEVSKDSKTPLTWRLTTIILNHAEGISIYLLRSTQNPPEKIFLKRIRRIFVGGDQWVPPGSAFGMLSIVLRLLEEPEGLGFRI